MKKIIKFFKKPSTLVIIVLLVTIFVLSLKNSDLKYSRLYEVETIPDINLTNSLYNYSNDNYSAGSISGFVAFYDKDSQPKGLKQYYIIGPLNKLDENLNRIFSLEEIVKMDYLPPTSINKYELRETSESYQMLTLEDETGNMFFINKNSDEVTMRDVGGDNTRLITNQSDYKNFIINLLK
ncbi:MAG: hypothetical protein C3F02_02770 [Parcubacteria group bacterium]|nr:MAG: hypothetical protein C3F02_02770 [Parcubacteria group bacterium]